MYAAGLRLGVVTLRGGDLMSGDSTTSGRSAPRRLVATILGGLMILYGISVLSGVPAGVGQLSSAEWPPVLVGPLATFWSLPLHWGWPAVGIGWLLCLLMVLGGVGVIARWPKGMRIAVVALSGLLLFVVPGVLFTISLALGWVSFGGDYILHRSSVILFMRRLYWVMLAISVIWAVALFLSVQWVRRQLRQVEGG